MAKRPQFNLPSTKPQAAAAKTDWVYRSDDAPAVVAKPAAPEPVELTPTQLACQQVIDRYSTYAGAAGFIPIPIADTLAIGGLQMRLIAELAAIYNRPFNEEIAKSLIAAMLGSITATHLMTNVGGLFVRAIPVVGVLVGALSVPAIGYGVTWAIGHVFAEHFESGGNLLNFNPQEKTARLRELRSRAIS